MNKQKIILLIIIASFAIIWGYFLLQKGGKESQPAPFQQTVVNKPIADGNFLSLAPQINNEEGVLIEVAPTDFAPTQPIKFEITFTTHQGDLDFDLTKQAILYDENGNQYLPLSWDGGRGGHHLSGALIFPAISADAKNMKLIIKDIYGVAKRKFEWEIKM